MRFSAAVLLLSASSTLGFTGLGRQSVENFRGNGIVFRDHFLRSSGSQAYYTEQTVDHTGQQAGVWNQRYFVNDSNWGGPGFPIFLYIGGEGPISEGAVGPNLFMSTLAEEHRAMKVALEHRFYGRSWPAQNMSSENLALLSHTQALADIKQFQAWFSEQHGAGNSKWVGFGGSYPGCLSAWTGMTMPDTFAGTVASSAPVRAQEEMWEYMDVVGASVRYIGGDACFDALAQAAQQIQSLLSSTQGRQTLAAKFGLCGPIESDLDVATFQSEVMGAVQGLVQYNEFQVDGEAHSPVGQLCSEMKSQAPLAALISVVKATSHVTGCLDTSYASTLASLRNTTFDGQSSMRQWIYQTCTYFGFYQTTTFKNQPFSWFSQLNTSYYETLCNDAFGITSPPNTAAVNKEFGGDAPIPSGRVVFVNGGVDPWHALGVYTNATLVADTDHTAVFSKDTSHCGDMYASTDFDVPSLAAAHSHISRAVSQWLGA